MTDNETKPMSEEDAISEAAMALRDHGIDIALPWNCDLDDLERARYDGLVAACHAYVEALSPALYGVPMNADVIDDLPLETARETLKKAMAENAQLIAERDEARRDALAWSQGALKHIGDMRAGENAFLNALRDKLAVIQRLAFDRVPPNDVTPMIVQECVGIREAINARLATGNWPAEVFKPLPEDEAKLLREY